MTTSEEVLKLLKELYDQVKYDKNTVQPTFISGATLSGLSDLIKGIEQEEVVIMDGEAWDEMFEELKFLDCLRAAGVDCWEGYELAQDMMSEEEAD